MKTQEVLLKVNLWIQMMENQGGTFQFVRFNLYYVDIICIIMD